MFAWWRQRQREKILAQPFPEAWRLVIDRNVGHAAFLDAEERKLLEDMSQVFLEEKQLEGCGGLELTDEIRVTVAANACLLLLGLDHDMYRRVKSVLIYPSTVRQPERKRGVFHGHAYEPTRSSPLLGEAHKRGPVILVWDAARHGSWNAHDGHNVIFHEFAHKLDMLDGDVDGTPPLRGSAQLRRWAEVCSRIYLELRARTERGRKTFLDAYGATNEAEFFAVATETFFEQPKQLRKRHPELYALLQDFYRQDPAQRVHRP